MITATYASQTAFGARVIGGAFSHISRRWSWLAFACILAVYIGTCFTPVVFDDNEGLYADAVKEMHARGDWLLPMSNGFPRVQKPPLVYWSMLVSTALLGENEFALRLPNALATVGWFVATYLIARRLGGERLGLVATLTLATMLGAWVFNHLVQPEPFLAAGISFAVWCLLEARWRGMFETKSRGWYTAFWFFLALGTMSKGLHGALWPLAAVLLAALLFPSTRSWLRPVLGWRGPLLFLIVILPWYIYMTARLPGFLPAHFINEQVGASLNTRVPSDTHQLPIWQFYAQHLLFWMPWTLLIPAAIAWTWPVSRSTSAYDQATPVRDGVHLLAVLTALIMLTLLFSTRQDYYGMSCWGFVAILLACPWAREDGVHLRRAWFAVPALLVTIAGFAALVLAGWTQLHLAAWSNGTAAPIASRDTFMDAVTGISPALWRRLLALLWIFGATTLVAGALAVVFIARRQLLAGFVALAASAAVPIVLGAAGFTIMSPYFSLADQARLINQELALHPQAMVACEALPNTASSLLYYLHARVHWVNAPFDNQYAQQVLGQGRDFYWDESELQRRWRTAGAVYLIVEQDRLDYWKSRLPGAHALGIGGTRVVLANGAG